MCQVIKSAFPAPPSKTCYCGNYHCAGDCSPEDYGDYNFRPLTYQRCNYGGWTIRVIGQGTDKSHYHITRVLEKGHSEYFIRYTDKQRFKANFGWFETRQEARDLKERICKDRTLTNHNEWDHNSYYDGWI